MSILCSSLVGDEELGSVLLPSSLCSRDVRSACSQAVWKMGLLEYPYGRGINLAMLVDTLDALLQSCWNTTTLFL